MPGIMQSTHASLHPAYRYSGLARSIDPAYPTNKAVLLFAPVAFLLGALYAYYAGYQLGETTLAGINAGLLLFIAWALTRELSPDDNVAAFVGAGFAMALWPRVGPQSILAPAVLLVAARLVNRSSGTASTMIDSVVVTTVFGSMAWLSSWAYGVVGILALTLDALLDPPGYQDRRRDHLAFAGLLVLVTGTRVIVGVEPPTWPAHLPAFATIVGLGLLAMMLYPRPRSVGDVDKRPLTHARVRGALAVGLAGAMLLTLDPGVDLFRLVGVWSCVLAVPMTLPFLLASR
jgi:hypothetical protein